LLPLALLAAASMGIMALDYASHSIQIPLVLNKAELLSVNRGEQLLSLAAEIRFTKAARMH
jgi:hypothetical protein